MDVPSGGGYGLSVCEQPDEEVHNETPSDHPHSHPTGGEDYERGGDTSIEHESAKQEPENDCCRRETKACYCVERFEPGSCTDDPDRQRDQERSRNT